MASKLLMTFLVLACSLAVHVMSSPTESDERIIEEVDVQDPELGTIHDVREVDSRCRHEKNTNFLPDGTNTTLLDDFQDGKGVVLISNTTDLCLVRDIDQQERDQADTCKDGMVGRDKNKPDQEEKTYVKSDTELSEEEREALPLPLQAACEGKQIYKLVPKEQNDDSSDGDVTSTTDGSVRRRKRSYGTCLRVVYIYHCYTSCSWWSCRRWCSVVKYYHLYYCSYWYNYYY